MINHYLKISFRNLRKYKPQNIISIVGLAAGFVCFSLSAMWVRYEMSFDNFHPKADRIYLVQTHPNKWDTQNPDASITHSRTSYPLARHLKTNFPEFEEVCPVRSQIMSNGLPVIYVDTAFFKMFDLANPPNAFFVRSSIKPAIVTNDFTATEFLKDELEYDIQTVTPRWSKNTNIPFQVICPLWVDNEESILTCDNCIRFETYVLLHKNVDVRKLEEKLDSILIGGSPVSGRPELSLPPKPVSISLTPIKKLNYSNPEKKFKNDIKFNHIFIFSLSGLLVILCALFNHTTLYVSQIQMRMREFALRKVSGSSNGQIIQLLYIEFLLVLFISLAIGLMLLVACIPHFKDYTGIGGSGIHIFTELMLFAGAIILFAFISGLFPILHFRKRTLLETIRQQHASNNKNLFRKVSLTLQLIISIGLLFCSLVIFKQMKFLIHTDLGINRRNVASVYADCCELNDPYKDKLKQIPGITDVLQVKSNFLKNVYTGALSTSSFSGNELKSATSFSYSEVENHFFEFFNIEIIEGKKFSNEFLNYPVFDSNGKYDPRSRNNGNMVVNETMAKGFEGNIIGREVGSRTVVGVARDFYITPTTKVKPAAMFYPDISSTYRYNRLNALAYRYEEGQRRQTQQAITQWMREEFPDDGEFDITFTYMDDIFEDYFKSERALLFLLSIVTGVCILISIFGVYSLTSLTCEQRRKEIAIRKINGAEVVDIMNIFFREYLVLLALASLIAFPAGYTVMKRWMESYVKQTSMDAWLFVLIFLIVFIVIVLTIVSMVWQAARRNPAEAVKS